MESARPVAWPEPLLHECVEAERIRGVGLLRGDDAAAGPLRAAVVAGEGDGADHAVAVDDGRPHLVVQAAGFGRGRGGQRGLQFTVAGNELHPLFWALSAGKRAPAPPQEQTL